MAPPRDNLIPGTLNLLILKALSAGPLHGYGIVKWIVERTDEVLRVEEGVLQHVSESPGKTTGHAKRAVGGKGEFVVRALARLEGRGRIRHDDGPRGAKLWYPA